MVDLIQEIMLSLGRTPYPCNLIQGVNVCLLYLLIIRYIIERWCHCNAKVMSTHIVCLPQIQKPVIANLENKVLKWKYKSKKVL